MNLALDLSNRCWHAPTKARESRVREAARRGRDLDLHKQYIRLYYSSIAKRLGVNASYIKRVANGEHQSEQLRRALLSELGLMQAAA